MTHYYQLIFLGDTTINAYDQLRECFLRRVDELGIDTNCIKIIKAEDFKREYENRQPSFVFFLGGDAINRKMRRSQKINGKLRF